MARFLKNRSKKIGKAPGTLTFIGRKKMDYPRFRLISYNETNYKELDFKTPQELIKSIEDGFVHWINIDGIHDPEVIATICGHFKLSPLVQEDIVNTDQRPKFVESADNLVVLLKQLTFKETKKSIGADQITLILGKGYVISFQEKVRETFNPIRERLSQNTGKLRSNSADYLFYRIIDALADNYMYCIGLIGELIENNEDLILSKSNKALIGEIYRYKTEINFLRKTVRPAKEVSKMLKNTETDLIVESTWPFFDHLDDLQTHILETIELYSSMITDQLYIYNTNLNNKTNDVMKIMTIFTALFVPLTFIVGVYGTNFDNLPELHFRYAYFAMWGVMIAIVVLLLFYFRRKKWF